MNKEQFKTIDAFKLLSIVDESNTVQIEIKDVKVINEYITDLQNELEEEKHINKINLERIDELIEKNESLRKVLNCKEYFTKLMPEETKFVLLTKADYDRQEKNIEEENIELKQRIKKAIFIIENDTTLNPERQRNRLKRLLLEGVDN